MISAIGSGAQALYGAIGRGTGEVPAVKPVRRREAEAAEIAETARSAGALEARAAAQNQALEESAPAARGASEAGKGLLVDLYA